MSRAALAAWVGRRVAPAAPSSQSASPWTADERARLRSGQPLTRCSASRTTYAGRACVVLQASRDDTWQVLDAVDRFPTFFPYLTAARPLQHERRHGVDDARYELELTVRRRRWAYTLHQAHAPDAATLPFQLQAVDPEALLVGGEGRWTAQRWDEDWSRTLLTVLIELHTRHRIPSLVVEPLARRALGNVVRLVGSRAEALHT